MSKRELDDYSAHYSEKGGHLKRGQFSRLQHDLKQSGIPATKGVITELVDFKYPPKKKK